MIVVAGESLIDLTPLAIGAETAYVPRPGGSPYNVALGLGRLGVPVSFLGRISQDRFGRLLRDHLADSGVGLDLVVDGDEPTTLALVHLGGDEPAYAFYAEGTAERLLERGEIGALPAGASLHVGSISLVLEPGASALTALMRQESGRRLISLDPNVRPGLIPDAAAYRSRFAEWLTLVDVVKVSVADLDWLAPGTEPAAAAARWIERGAALVLVTSGATGSSAFTAGATVQAAGPTVVVADTVGAGDAFTSGALAHLHAIGALSREGVGRLSRPELLDLLTAANAVAADTCTRPGADPPRR
jgi:fructokinase